jgi:hypothetical protein
MKLGDVSVNIQIEDIKSLPPDIITGKLHDIGEDVGVAIKESIIGIIDTSEKREIKKHASYLKHLIDKTTYPTFDESAKCAKWWGLRMIKDEVWKRVKFYPKDKNSIKLRCIISYYKDTYDYSNR